MPSNKMTHAPDYLTISMELLNHAKRKGFYFRRTLPIVDAPMVGIRYRPTWTEVVRIDGWKENCSAWKQSNRLVLAGPPVGAEDYVAGSALNVLNRVVTWQLGFCRTSIQSTIQRRVSLCLIAGHSRSLA